MAHHHPLSGHLWNAALLAGAAMLALAAERLSADPAGPATRRAPLREFSEFVAPVTGGAGGAAPGTGAPLALRVDPLEPGYGEVGVARASDRPTVQMSRRERQLTAILIADDRPVAVIDGSVVNVGDTLPDGARVSAIRTDRVAIIEPGGQWRVLTMTPGRP